MLRRLLVPLALVVATAPLPAGAAPRDPRPAQWGATWLAARVTPRGYVAGPDGTPDVGSSVVTGIALAAAGVAPTTVRTVAGYVAANTAGYARPDGTDRPGALGRLAMLAAVAGHDPNAYGGAGPEHRLVDRILATQTPAGPYAGLLADPRYTGTFNHSLGLLGVATTGSLTTDQVAATTRALDWLVAQQCPDGGWQNAPRPWLLGTVLTSCGSGANGPDTNATALAVQALAAHRRKPAVDPLGWIDKAQNAAGGFGYLPGGATDADSTALVVQAVLALGAEPTSARFTAGGTNALAALLALQVRCSGAAADRGAFAYMRAGDGALRPNFFATAEAVPAAARRPFPVRRARGGPSRVPMPCGRS